MKTAVETRTEKLERLLALAKDMEQAVVAHINAEELLEDAEAELEEIQSQFKEAVALLSVAELRKLLRAVEKESAAEKAIQEQLDDRE